MYTEPQVTEEFQKLKDQLTALSSIKQSASSPHAEVSAINCFQDLIQQYIEKALRSGIETSQVKNDMEKLCRVHLVIPAVLWTWTMQEVDKANEKLTSELRKVVKPKVKEGTPKPSLFSKDTLYHASLCCDAINVSTSLAKPQSYFQNKNPQHNFTEVSFSQSRDSITPYLIAKLHDVIYVAFQSTPFLDKWMENATSFNEGLPCTTTLLQYILYNYAYTTLSTSIAILCFFIRTEAAKQSNSSAFLHGRVVSGQKDCSNRYI